MITPAPRREGSTWLDRARIARSRRRGVLLLLLVLVVLAATALPASAATGAAGLTGDVTGCDQHALETGDHAPGVSVALPFELDFLGPKFQSVFVDTNGILTFGAPLVDAEPFPLATVSQAVVAPFLADIDPPEGSWEDTSTTFGVTSFEGRDALCVVWQQRAGDDDSLENAFQALVVDRSDTGAGNFDLIFDYARIESEQSDLDQQRAGPARVGYSNGTGADGTWLELPGSGVSGSFLDSSPTGLTHNGSDPAHPGRYTFAIRNPAAPVVTSEPVDATAQAGETAVFRAAASGVADPTVQWQVASDGTHFTSIADATSTTLSVAADPGADGDLYRAVFTNAQGTALTRAAKLAVTPAPVVSPSPPAPSSAASTESPPLATALAQAPAPPPTSALDTTPATADLSLTLTALPALIRENQTATLTIVVSNHGPGVADDVTLRVRVATSLALVSVTTTQGSCSGSRTLVCSLGTLAAGGAATVAVSAKSTRTGAIVDAFATTADVSASEPDTEPADNSVTAAVKVALAPPPEPPSDPPVAPLLPPPIAGRFFNVQPVTGTVFVNGHVLPAPDQLPVSAVIDARGGSVELIVAGGRAVFWGGVFEVRQPRTAAGVTELVLQPVVPASVCAPGPRPERSVAMSSRPKVRALLWGSGHGRFRTVGRFSSATVRGTKWLMAERCDGTFTYVRTGVVSLSDRTRRVTLLLRAGHSYLAKPTAPKQKHPKPKVKANTKAKTKSITPARPKQGSSAHRAGASAAASAGMER